MTERAHWKVAWVQSDPTRLDAFASLQLVSGLGKDELREMAALALARADDLDRADANSLEALSADLATVRDLPSSEAARVLKTRGWTKETA